MFNLSHHPLRVLGPDNTEISGEDRASLTTAGFIRLISLLDGRYTYFMDLYAEVMTSLGPIDYGGGPRFAESLHRAGLRNEYQPVDVTPLVLGQQHLQDVPLELRERVPEA